MVYHSVFLLLARCVLQITEFVGQSGHVSAEFGMCDNPSTANCRVFLFPADLLDKTSLPVCYSQRHLFSCSNYSLQVSNVPGMEIQGR